jgi:hypothetical protein
VFSTDVRWWLGTAAYTTDTLREEIQAIYDGGFRGVELCMQSASNGAPNATYAYGSPHWSYMWKLMMNELLDLGMGVYLTSGTHWATSNVPGLDPDSQEASQVLAMSKQEVQPGQTVAALLKPGTTRATNKGSFIGAYAYRLIDKGTRSRTGTRPQSYTYYDVDYGSVIDLSDYTTFTEGGTIYDQALDTTWTAPGDGTYLVCALWTHGNYASSSPAVTTSYATNYFDKRGVEALREFWEANYLDDPVLNQKILEGDVQLFMDSLELNPGGGITWWTEDIRQEFIDRKGYDILPYIFLVEGLPQVQAVYNPYMEPAQGFNDLYRNKNLREKIVNDWVDVTTTLYCENMLAPLKEWLNSVGIKTRAQISYGRSFEITEPSMYVDFPEAENFNQYNNIDIMRLHTAGGKLQNKVISTETGTELSNSSATPQMHMKDAYQMYAAGVQRVVWHLWGANYGYGRPIAWPGNWAGMAGFHRFSTRNPNFMHYDEFNAHLGRIQRLVQEGRSRTDIGFIHNNWNQGLRYGGGIGNDITGMNWQLAHQGVYYRSTELQDNGYTYDYFSPKFLFDDDVYFDEETKTIEKAGYKALVLYQDWLDIKGAKRILEWAEKGLPVVILDGAAVRTPFADGSDEDLAEVIDALKALPTVRTAAIYDASAGFNYFLPLAEGYSDGVYAALQELGVRPYAEFAGSNHQLLAQSRQDDDGNMYLYVFNYCSNDYHHNSHIESVRHEDHGLNIKTEIRMDGIFIPYAIDAWSGEVTELAHYNYENGQTVFPVDLDYSNIALYAFEAVNTEKLHIVSTDAAAAYVGPKGPVIRVTESGVYNTELSNGVSYQSVVSAPPAAYNITNWDVTIESWTPNPTVSDLERTETLLGVTTVNTNTSTVKTQIRNQLPVITTWNNIPGVGRAVSGLGHYEATFNWDAGKADGAYLDMGDTFAASMSIWINGVKVGGDVSTNPTKVKKNVSGLVDGQPVVGKELYSGGVNWTKPIVDIGDYLVDGVNTIVIECSSDLTNVSLDRRLVNATTNRSGYWGYNIDYREYGPSQAVIVPYAEVATTSVGVTAAESIPFGGKAEYTFSASDMDAVNLVELTFAVDGNLASGAQAAMEGLNGFELFDSLTWQDLGNNQWRGSAILGIPARTRSGSADIGKLTLNGVKPGDLKVTLTNVRVYGIDIVDGAAKSNERISAASPASATTKVVSAYDINGDNVVDMADLSLAFYYYQSRSGGANWENAKVADVNGDNVVDMLDLAEIYAHFVA